MYDTFNRVYRVRGRGRVCPTHIYNVLVAPLLPHQFTGFPASLKRDLLNVRCLLLTNFRLFLSRTFVLCRLLNYDLTPTKKAQELAFVVEHNIEGALGVFFIDAMGKIGCQVSKREVQNPSTFFSHQPMDHLIRNHFSRKV